MYLSNYAKNMFMNVFRGQNFAAPSAVYAGLFLSNPTANGTAGVELAYAGYRRMEISFNPPAAEGSGIGIRNSNEIVFPESPIDAGTVRFVGIYDAITGGNMFVFGEITEPIPVVQGESPVLLLNEVLFFSLGELTAMYKTRLFNVLRGITLPGITPFLSLWNGDPEYGGNELAGENYAHLPLDFTAPVLDAGGAAIITNSQDGSFNRPTTNWGVWSETVIMDASSGGSPVWKQPRTAKPLSRGIMPITNAGDISLGII
jgi:hypothetical protein